MHLVKIDAQKEISEYTIKHFCLLYLYALYGDKDPAIYEVFQLPYMSFSNIIDNYWFRYYLHTVNGIQKLVIDLQPIITVKSIIDELFVARSDELQDEDFCTCFVHLIRNGRLHFSLKSIQIVDMYMNVFPGVKINNIFDIQDDKIITKEHVNVQELVDKLDAINAYRYFDN